MNGQSHNTSTGNISMNTVSNVLSEYTQSDTQHCTSDYDDHYQLSYMPLYMKVEFLNQSKHSRHTLKERPPGQLHVGA